MRYDKVFYQIIDIAAGFDQRSIGELAPTISIITYSLFTSTAYSIKDRSLIQVDDFGSEEAST